jgi:hypothetical protein
MVIEFAIIVSTILTSYWLDATTLYISFPNLQESGGTHIINAGYYYELESQLVGVKFSENVGVWRETDLTWLS